MSDINMQTEKAASIVYFTAQKEEKAAVCDRLVRLGYASDVVHSGGISAANEWCKHNAIPHLIFADIDKVNTPLLAVAELIERTSPTSKLIVVGSDQSIDQYRALLSIGVFDYLVKPAPLDMMAKMIQKARRGDESESFGTGRTISVTGSSGGIGTSLVAYALGRLLSNQRYFKSALVDFDRKNGCLDLMLGAQGESGLDSVLQTDKIDSRLLERSMTEIDGRLSLLAQQPNYQAKDIDDTDQLLLLGAGLCRIFNQVIWDLPSSQPYGSLEVLKHSQARIILVDLTVADARNTLRLLNEIGDESNGQRILLVRNTCRQQNVDVITQTAFEEFVGRKIDMQLPFVGGGLSKSLLQGKLSFDAFPELTRHLLHLTDLACGKEPQELSSSLPFMASFLSKLRPNNTSKKLRLKGARL
ncbi:MULTISPECIES: AAA family ATPase [Marinomonas]|jgi:Flp pilus assembly protein, ATPase CpaE|uniref:Response regulator receiver protein n=2 Tax=Marinomonas TaxID=28253 RepID=F2K0W4_MARM1|nr:MULTISPECIES: response regulator [Marinomonas]ADZ93313.1 response regulator receiver protein [Marinomonas mediterranea MMB-1]TDO97535.1 pilus assembly protein CpaE [Marinomonas balearica]WCN11203.1 histidine kinase [Marinomonas mediterranea]WCN19311.1 histidine kinase [Marinomonas mediterranea MMB-1]